MSAVFLPLAFVVGFFGQNFQQLVGISGWMQSASMMWVMIALCLGIPFGMVVWFRRKRWI
jgi:magnesium transporter